jgi:hypothetical protein
MGQYYMSDHSMSRTLLLALEWVPESALARVLVSAWAQGSEPG